MSSHGPFQLESGSVHQITLLARLIKHPTQTFFDEHLIPLITQTSVISLRALDWLVTNFAKKYNVVCQSNCGMLFNIHQQYKTALFFYKRRYFDPFRRRERCILEHKGVKYETTVGQCNFMHWAYINGVLLYAYSHAEELEEDMIRAATQQRLKQRRAKEAGVTKRRTELSKAVSQKCSVYSIETRVQFS